MPDCVLEEEGVEGPKASSRHRTVAQGRHGRKDRTGRLKEGWAWVEVSPRVQGARTFDLVPLRLVLEPVPACAQGSGHCGGRGRIPTGPAPGLPLPGCKQTHAFAVANRRG